MKHPIPLFTVAAIIIIGAPLFAQPPGGGRGPSGGSPFGGGRGGFDPREMLKRMDTNGNGVLDNEEVSERARYFVKRAAERAGVDPNKPIKLDDLFKSFDERRKEEEKQREKAKKEEDDDTVPGFGNDDDDELPIVPGFNLPADSPLLSKKPLEERYDRRILDEVRKVLGRYDLNRNEVLDAAEWKGISWQTDPKTSDLDGDGRLSKVELAERYAKRYGNSMAEKKKKKSTSSSSSKSKSTAKSSTSDGEKVRKYAESLLKQYDKNKSGVLEKEEWAKMPKPERYNTNRDKIITLDELAYGARNYGSSSSASSSSSLSSKYGFASVFPQGKVYRVKTQEELTKSMGVPSTFTSKDKDGDLQLVLSEFTTSLDSDSKLEDFKKHDLNGDWLITAKEWLEAGKKK